MNISLTEHFNNYIEEKVKSGKYYSASEVVRSALRLMEENEKLRETEAAYFTKALQEGIESGEPVAFTADEFIARAKEKMAGV